MTPSDPLIPAEVEPTGLPKEPGAEPLPGYRLIEPLGSGSFGEVWKCEVPGGLFKAIKFVTGGGYDLGEGHSAADQELDALHRIKTVRHPFILSIERAEVVRGELLIVTELADRSLREVLDECRRNGMPGIPRPTLLGLMLEAAEALDVMNLRYGLQHLDIKPGNLFLVCDHLKVGDFGQVASLGKAPAGAHVRPRGSFTALYAAPEILQGTITSQSDQYSLAVVYQELLTGTLPCSGKNARQLLMQRLTGEPDLSALPPGDRPVVARALSRVPQRRFPSCLEFARALLAVREAAPALSKPERRAVPADARGSDGSTLPAGRRGRHGAKAGGPDRRVSVRYTCKASTRARIRLRSTCPSNDAYLRDISAMGVGLVFPHDVEAGTNLFVQLPGARGGTMTTHLAEVVHVVPWEAGTWLVGCKWVRSLSERELQHVLGDRPSY